MNKLDIDKLRERFLDLIDSKQDIPIVEWCEIVGLSQGTLYAFIHGSKAPRRKTLLAIYKFLEGGSHG